MYDDYESKTNWGRVAAVIVAGLVVIALATAAVALVVRTEPAAWNQAVTDVARATSAIGWAVAGFVLIGGLSLFALAMAWALRHVEDGRREHRQVVVQVDRPAVAGLPAERTVLTATLVGPSGTSWTIRQGRQEPAEFFVDRVLAEAQRRPGWTLVEAPRGQR